MKQLLTITTDYGDSFATSQLKAVAFSLGFTGQLIENHDVSPYSIIEGAYGLAQLAKYCPDDSVHVGIIDPEVGTPRRAIILYFNYLNNRSIWFVGPDNGLCSQLVKKATVITAWQIDQSRFGKKISNTFHGRDIFIRAAVLIAQGDNPTDFGCQSIEESSLQRIEYKPGQIIHIDSYGNLKVHWPHITESIRRLVLSIRGKKYKIPFTRTFFDVPKGQLLAYNGSSDTLEIAINQGNAKEKLGVKLEEVLAVIPG